MFQIPCQFSRNQLEYLIRCESSWFNEAEGGKRSGKNILNAFAFCRFIENHKNKLFLVAGVTQAIARINVLDSDGYGVYNYFHGRYKKGKYENKEALYVRTKRGTKIIVCVGGGKQGDFKLIRGMSLGGAYLTEINLLDIEFIKEVFDRTMASDNRKIFSDLNPKAPNHKYYKEIESIHAEKQKENPYYGFNYGHFTIADNMSLSSEKIRDVLNTYDKASIYYKRDIRGERIACEGLCYPMFAKISKELAVDSIDTSEIMKIVIGVDYGGGFSSNSFTATAITKNFKKVVVLKAERHDAEGVTPEQLNEQFCQFVNYIYAKYQKAMHCNCDSAEQTLINGMKRESARRRLPIILENAWKEEIIDRIRAFNMLVSQGRFQYIKGECDSLVDALCNAVWDEKQSELGKDVRLDNGTTDIDSLDSFEYTYEQDMEKLIKCA